MHTILKSQVEKLGIADVRKEIAQYANEYRAWLAHTINVNHPDNKKKEAGDPTKSMPYPPPVAHGIVMQAVDPAGNVSYEFVDDTVALSKQSIEGRRAELFNAVAVVEHEEIAKVVTPGKSRLLDLTFNRIMKKKEEDYTQEDTEFLEDYEEKKEKIEAIQFWAATLHSEIADLASENIFDWKVPSYQG